MDPEIEELHDRLRHTPPRCIGAFQLAASELPESWGGDFRTVWRLSCNCGGEIGAVLGYSLGQLNTQYDGPTTYVSPLAFECSACPATTEILDTDLHGYHSEVARLEGGTGGATFRGAGLRDRFLCPYCGASRFSLTLAFVYWGAAFDLAQDEPEIALEDFFNAFLAYGACENCGKSSPITVLEKL